MAVPLLVSHPHHWLDVIQKGQLVSVVRLLHCSLAVSNFQGELIVTTADHEQSLVYRQILLRLTSGKHAWCLH